MENLEKDPLGEVGAAASQGQSDEIQPTETTDTGNNEVKTEATVENPWDEDPKFKGKSPEDIYKAYKESEKLTGQLSQKAQIANLIEEKYGLTPEQFKAQLEQQAEANLQQQYAENPLAPVVDKVSQLEQVVQQQQEQAALAQEEKELDNFLQENPDYKPFRNKILKLGLSAEQDKSYEEIANEWFGQAISQGQQTAYQKIETKEKTQATSPTNAKATKPSLDEMSVEEMEKVLPHA